MAHGDLGSGEGGLGLSDGEFRQLNAETEWVGELRWGRNRGDERNESEEE